MTFFDLGRYEDGERILTKWIQEFQAPTNKWSSKLLPQKLILTLCLMKQLPARWEEGEQVAQEAVQIAEATLGLGHEDTCEYRKILAQVKRNRGRFGDAEALAVESSDALNEILGSQHPKSVDAEQVVAQIRSSDRND